VVDVIGSLKKHVERQQSENREARASAASVKEEDNEEELNVEESSSAGGDDIVQPNNDVTGGDWNLCAVLAATTTAIPTSEVAEGKKRSREATSSTRNARLPTSSKKRVKLPHSTVQATSEEAGTTAQSPVLRRSARSAKTKAREGTFEGTIRGIGAEEADADLMPVVEEEESPLDDGNDDNDEDERQGMVAKRAQQGRAAIKSFYERFKDLMDFKHKFGHCNVPTKQFAEYQSLGVWCSKLRCSYRNIQQRETPQIKLTQERIRQLEDAGFKWSLSSSTFDEQFAELMKYKEKFGHCNVSRREPVEYQSLGFWCDHLRAAYKKIQNSETPKHKLSEEQIRQLEDAGFKWSLSTRRTTSSTFDGRFAELMKYKEKFGHCNVPQKRTGEYKSLGNWCDHVRTAYKKIQKRETPNIILSEDNIRQLEDAGFKWFILLST